MPDKKIIIAVVVLLLVTIIGGFFVFRGGDGDSTPSPSPSPSPQPKPNENGEISLTMWGVFDENTVMQPLINQYQKEHPNIKITYVKKQFSDYEQLIVDAIASDKAPDIVAVHSNWLPKHQAKLSPAPESIITIDQFNSEFVPSAYQDFVANNRVYGIPLYTDNLALFYNRQLFNRAEIYSPPTTWDEVIDYAKIISTTKTGDPNKIEQGGIALGANNVNRSADILLALMYQTETPIISSDRRTYNFNQFRKGPDGNPEYPGTQSLNFFTSFAIPERDSFVWDATMGDSVSAFAQGKVAMMVGYQYMVPQIERINPNLSYSIVKFPQIRQAPAPITVSNYWGWGVTRNSINKDESWRFLRFLSADDTLQGYLSSTGRTSSKKYSGSGGSVFAQQAQYAKTLYKGNSDIFDKIFTDMIADVVQFNQPPQIAIDTAARKANEMIKDFY